MAIDDYKSVEMLVLDSKLITSSPDKLTNLLLRNNVKYVIGPVFGDDAVKMQNALGSLKYFSLSNNARIANKNMIVCGISPKDDIKTLFNYQIASGRKKILALIPKNSYGDIINSIIDKLDTKESYIRKIRYIKYSNNLIKEQLYDTNFDTIFVCENLNSLPNLDGISYMVPYSLLSDEFLNNYNVVYASPNKKNLLKFKKYYRINFGTNPSNIALVGFDVANVVFSICDKNTEVIENKSYHGVLGKFHINDNDILERKWEVYEE